MAVPAPRQRARSGVPLIALGIVLALATAVLVLFLTSNLTTFGGSGTQVVVAARNLSQSTLLTGAGDAFKVVHMPANLVPADAYLYKNQSELDHLLQGQMVLKDFLSGDVLRQPDARIGAGNAGPPGSSANIDPANFPSGDVLYELHIGNDTGMQVGAVRGDHVDVIATICVTSSRSNCQMVQNTLQDLPIYAVPNPSTLMVAVSVQNSLVLELLVNTAKLSLVIVKPGDAAPVVTQPVTIDSVVKLFGLQS